MGKKRTVESYLPLTPALFHVLLALADGEKHGYVISKEIARRTDNEVNLSTGTLYGIIKRLLEDAMIEESQAAPGLQPGRPAPPLLSPDEAGQGGGRS